MRHMRKKCDSCDTTFLDLFFQVAFFPKKLVQCCWQVFMKADNVLPFVHLAENTILLDMTEITNLPKLLFLFLVTHITLFQHTPA